jgi:hypothetical protein
MNDLSFREPMIPADTPRPARAGRLRSRVNEEGRRALESVTDPITRLDEMGTTWVLSPRLFPLEAESALVVDLFVNGLAFRPVVPPHTAFGRKSIRSASRKTGR